jgi:hypothetical protein
LKPTLEEHGLLNIRINSEITPAVCGTGSILDAPSRGAEIADDGNASLSPVEK